MTTNDVTDPLQLQLLESIEIMSRLELALNVFIGVAYVAALGIGLWILLQGWTLRRQHNRHWTGAP